MLEKEHPNLEKKEICDRLPNRGKQKRKKKKQIRGPKII